MIKEDSFGLHLLHVLDSLGKLDDLVCGLRLVEELVGEFPNVVLLEKAQLGSELVETDQSVVDEVTVLQVDGVLTDFCLQWRELGRSLGRDQRNLSVVHAGLLRIVDSGSVVTGGDTGVDGSSERAHDESLGGVGQLD